jgi:hypothetical protein
VVRSRLSASRPALGCQRRWRSISPKAALAPRRRGTAYCEY